MAATRRVSLFERSVSVRLAPLALELLHGNARVLTEGELLGELYAGSTYLTVDLARTTALVSDPPDATTAQRLAFLYASDERCRAEARGVALAEARRVSGNRLATSTSTVDVESRAKGTELHVSLSVEARRVG